VDVAKLFGGEAKLLPQHDTSSLPELASNAICSFDADAVVNPVISQASEASCPIAKRVVPGSHNAVCRGKQAKLLP
jgi:hypothetical protein